MKFETLCGSGDYSAAPSVWRVWIEIARTSPGARPGTSHPPCGGCGLKFYVHPTIDDARKSPSVWRVWIEIASTAAFCKAIVVTLRVEGVD